MITAPQSFNALWHMIRGYWQRSENYLLSTVSNTIWAILKRLAILFYTFYQIYQKVTNDPRVALSRRKEATYVQYN
jgi:hypothetical protein